MVKNKQRWLSLVMALIMLFTSGIANLTVLGAEGIGIMPLKIIAVYADEELHHDNPTTRQPVLYNPNYSQSDGGSLIPDIVSWIKPGTDLKYMAYCIDPGKKGWESNDSYNIEIHDMTNFQEDHLLYDGAREEFTDEIAEMLVNVVSVGYPSRTAEDVLGISFAESGLSDKKEFEYIAYLITKFTIWTVVREDRTDSRKLNIDDWKIDTECNYSNELKQAAYNAIRDIYAKAKNYTPAPIQDVQITHTPAALQDGSTNVYESVYTITNSLPGYLMNVYEENGAPFPPEVKITDTNGNEFEKTPKLSPTDIDRYIIPSDSTSFKLIYTDNSGGDIDFSMNLTVEAPDGRKILLYGIALKANRQNYILAGNRYSYYYTDFSLTSEGENPEGKLTVRKTDGNGKLLTGAVFEFVDTSGKPVTVEDVSKNMLSTLTENGGVHTAEHLRYGTYRVKEKSAPPGYDLLTDIFTMVISEQSPAVTIEVPNIKGGSGDWYILKLDAKTGLPLSGVTFDIYSNATGAFIESGTSGSNGKYIPSHQEAGIYTVIERQTNSNYEYTPPTSIVVDVREDVTMPIVVTFRDFSNTMLRVHKVDADGKPIPGVEFEMVQIYTSTGTQGSWRGVATTDAQGWAEFDTDVAGNPPPSGAYIVREVSTVAGFIRNTTEQWVTIGQSMPPSLKFVNSKKPGLTILKQDQSDNSMITEVTKFRVEQIDGSYTWEGDTKGGMVTLDNLSPGSYRITELNPPKGYVGSTEVKTAHLMPDEHIQVVFLNPHKPRLLIEKIDGQSGTPVPGTKFELVGIDNNFKGTVTVGANGTVLVGDDGHELGYLEPGSYEVTEIFVPSPYVLTGETQTVYLGEGEIKRLTFMNLEMPSLLIEKYDEKTGEKLPGAQFGVYWQDDLGLPVFEGLTDKDGKILIEYLKPGWYTVKELNPPPGYLYSNNPLLPQARSVQLNPGAGTVTVKFDNIKMPQLTIRKIDAVTQKPLAGFTFRVEETDGTSFQPATVTTNAVGEIIIPGLRAGTYTVTEIACPSNYILDGTPQTVKMEGGDTKTLLFQNTMYPTLVITKTDYSTNNPVPDTTFKVEYENTTGGIELIGTYKTDASGRIVLLYVKPGWYQITETIAAQGMQLPTNPVTRIYLNPGTNSYTDTSGGNVGGSVTYSITSGFDYPVVAGVVNYPLNSIVIKKADANTGEMLSGATFELIKTSGETSGQNGTTIGTYTTDASGIIVITGVEGGTYVVKETRAPQNYIIAETTLQTVTMKADKTSIVEVTFRNFPYGNILVTKVDGLTGEPLADATFKVTDNDGAAVGNSTGEFTTDSQGQFLVSNVKPGSYVVTEIQAPANYAINTTPKTLVVGTDGQTYKLSFDNYPYGTLVIKKLDAASREPLQGAEFKVTDSSNAVVGNSNGFFTTDASGVITIPHLPKGSYIIKEIKAPDGYVLENNTQTIDIDYGKTYTVDIYNKKMSSLQIIKIDSETKQPLKHAQFTVYKANGEILGRYETDADGVIIVDALDPGWYKAVETKAPDGYLIDETPKDFEIKANQFVQLIFENNLMSGLLVRKVDAETLAPLSGMEFTVKTMSGALVGNYRTGADGTSYIPEIAPGWYAITEKKAPDGYSLGFGDNTQTVEIKHSKLVVIEFRNKPFGSIIIKKIDEINGAPLAGAYFSVTHQNGGLVGEYTTGNDGTVSIPNMDTGWYVISETKAPTGYTLDSTAKTVEVKPGIPTVTTFTNKPLSGIEIIKTDSVTHNPLANATFVVEKANGEKIGTYKTDVSGKVIVSDLTEGTYVVSEKIAPDGYHLNEIPKTVIVISGKLTTVEFSNKPYSGIQIIKTDAVSNAPLAGAVFKIERTNGERIGDKYTTDIAGKIIIPDLIEGVYIISEIQAPAEYVLDSLPQTVEVKSGKMPIAEFVNTPYPYLHIVKTDASTGQLLSGAEFVVTNAYGEIIATVTSQASGPVSLKVAPGVYTVTEVKAPAGYENNDPVQMVEVRANGSAVYYGTNIAYPNNSAIFANRPLNAIQILKLDSITNNPLAKALFVVEKSDGTRIGSFLTDSAGGVLISGLTEGTYIIKEISAPAGYQLDETPKTINISGGRVVDVAFTNKPLSGIQITKLDAVTLIPLKDASFTVTKVNGEKIGTFRTEADGTVVIPDLEEGTYVVGEITAPTGYQLDETPKNVNVVSGRLATVEFTNKPYSGIQIIKTDSVTNAPLANATFTVDRSNGARIGVYKTDAAGQILIPDLAEGTYIISETAAPNGYMLDNTPKTVTVVSGRITMVEFSNKPHSGIQITKTDAVTHVPLVNATFTVDRSTGERIGIYRTDAAGQILVPDLAEGTYIISETAAPNGYMLDQTPKTVTVVSGRITEVGFTNAPYGSLVIKKTDEITGRPLAGAYFTVTHQGGSAVGDFITDNDGSITVPNLEPGWYVISETKAPNGYHLDSAAKTIEVKSHVPTSITFTNRPYSGIEIVKIDAVTKAPLAGATFTVERSDGSKIGTYKTDAAGKILVSDLLEGSYIVSEVAAPTGYILNDTPKTVTVVSGRLASVEFSNSPYGSLIIKKTDEITSRPLAGAHFTVKHQNGAAIGDYVTDNDGTITIPNLEPGWYVVSEIKAPSSYHLDSAAKTIEVKSHAPTSITFTNRPYSGIEIIKTDAVTHAPLAGATFTVMRSNGENIGSYKTDAAGKIVVSNIAEGTYIVSETIAPDGYQLDETPKTVIVTSGKLTTVEFSNKPYSGIEIIKLNAITKAPLMGATFTVEYANGEKVGMYKTDAAGKIIVNNLPEGTYIVSETVAPDGFMLDEAPKTVIVKSGKLTTVEFTNKPHSGIEIIKIDAVTKAPLMGATFTVERPNGEKIGTYKTDISGKIIISNLSEGTYIVSETAAPDGYQLDETPKTVIVTSGKLTTVEFTNKPHSGIIIYKFDTETKAPLTGATFLIERVNGERIGTYKTDRTGKIIISNLSEGTYIVSEVEAPYGYILDEAPKSVIVKSGKVTEIEFFNKPLAGLRIIKLNSVTRNPIEGVEFSLNKLNGERVENEFRGYTFKTDRTGQIYIPRLENGYYVVTETRTVDGYILDGEPKTVLVESGKISVLEVLNMPMSGLLIVKTDAKTGQPLQGVVFDVRKADGQHVMSNILDQNQPNTQNNSPNKTTTPNGDISGSYVTDANGRILINTLEPGEYHVIETKALDGYILDKEVHAVTVVPGKQASLQLTNTPMSGLRILKIDTVTKKGIYDVEFRVYDFNTNKEVGGPYRTDNNGVIDFSGILPEGRYTIVETREAPGYLRDTLPRTIEFQAGKILEIVWENTPLMGQVQVMKKSSADNEVNGLPAGTPLAGAAFEIYHYKTGTLMDQFTTGNNGVGVSKPLPIGRYILKEVVSPKYYKLNDKEIDFEIEFSSQIVKFEFTNEPANTGVSIKKVGPAETMSGQQIRYDFKVIQNTSTVPLTDFYFRDIIPGNVLRVDKVITGTYNQGLKYKIMYKTNKNDYRVMADNLSTTHNNVVDASPAALGLFSDEYVTEIMFVFGNVKAGFSLVENPAIYATVKDGIPKGFQFANKADIGGKYGNEWIISNTTWVTTTYSSQPDKLPRTGY